MRARIWLERVAQTITIVIVAWLLIDALRPSTTRVSETVRPADLAAKLRRWSTVTAPHDIHLALDQPISPVQRAWLAALMRTGASVGWTVDAAPPLAIETEPVADPKGGTRIRVGSPAGALLQLLDPLGGVDSLTAGVAGASFVSVSPRPAAIVRTGSFNASSAVRDTLLLGRLLVVGKAGWESGMVTAALEEQGWAVDAVLGLSPQGDVVQGDPGVALSTDRYSAVVVLDTVALTDPTRLVRYVRSGGGLVMNAAAAASASLAALRPGTPGQRIEATEPFDTTAPPRLSLALTAIQPGPRGVALELRDGRVAVAARRVDRGRVALIGYEDTWRWRMAGAQNADDEHRAWWAALVASVATAERRALEVTAAVDEAPLAAMNQWLGDPSELTETDTAGATIPDEALFAVLAAALLSSWISRRLRGAA